MKNEKNSLTRRDFFKAGTILASGVAIAGSAVIQKENGMA